MSFIGYILDIASMDRGPTLADQLLSHNMTDLDDRSLATSQSGTTADEPPAPRIPGLGFSVYKMYNRHVFSCATNGRGT
jgi:hypothetical protein